MHSGATISDCGLYRYRLTRDWGASSGTPTGGRVAFVMLNPSTADATQDDPTIRRCVGFAKAWGYLGLEVFNLFALRSTDPDALYAAKDPVGPENDRHLLEVARNVGLIVAAWGVHGRFRGRGTSVRALLGPNLKALGLTKDGHPKHPLYVPAAAQLVSYASLSARTAEAGRA